MKSSYSLRVRPVALLLMTGALFVAAGCARKETATVADAAPAVPGEKRYPLKGEIIAVNKDRGTLTITHEAIKDYMPGMTMEFKAAAGDLAIAKPGEHIRAELVVRGQDFSLEKIWPDDTATAAALAASANTLAQDTVMRGKGAYREIGETLPDFTLLDQEGRTVSGSRFRGKQVVLNFIFTRCPVANMCPAATLRMMALQKAAHTAGVTDLELVSISLDPEYDTPGVLKDYAAARGIDTSNFSFLTGPDAAVRQMLAQLGILREFDGPTIKHTLATVLVNEQGKISYRVDGSVWTPDEFIEHMRKG
ncbi:MAG TPA: SCO family protein [Lacunisphaera sp.]|nr:SCO family protein [Lacunisphaera sp.]